jgi:NADH-quinone oxidoreductase subunit L
MAIPLWILAALTVGLGLRFAVVGADVPHGPAWLAPLSLGLAVVGFLLAVAMYQRALIDPARVAVALGPMYMLARHRYGIDALYGALYRGFILGFSWVVGWVDRYLVDGLLNGLSALTLRGGDALRRLQTGQAQDYVYGVAFGVLVLLVWAQWGR